MSLAILLRMRRACLVLSAALLASCGDVPPTVQPSPIPVAPAVPARITINAVVGIGAAAGDVYLAARVFTDDGRPVGATAVTFSTNAGTVAPTSVLSDGSGLAQATVKTAAPTNVRVVAGAAVATLDVTPNAPQTPIPPVDPTFPPPVPTVPVPPSVPPPPPPPPTPPTAPLPPAGLQVTLGCTTSALTVACNLAASYNGVPLQSTPPTFTSVDWDWGDGQSTLVTPGSPLGTHAYVQAGTYTIVPHATVLTVDGNKQASTTTSVKVP